MKSYLVILKDKQIEKLDNDLLISNIEYLKWLKLKEHLIICGPFQDNTSAVLILKTNSYESIEKIIKQDPFIINNYYGQYSIKEFIEANDENDWLQEAH